MMHVLIPILIVFLRFPVKRLSAAKQALKEKNVKKPVKETPPLQRTRGRQRMKQQQQQQQQDEKEEVEKADKEELLSQSLKKRDKNIQENKAMVMNPDQLWCFLHILTNCVLCVLKCYSSFLYYMYFTLLCCCLPAS